MADTFFSMFSPEEIARISASGTRVKLPEGWAPISEKTAADKAYIILDGTVSVRAHGEEVAQLGPGDIVGEAAILNHSLRTAIDRRADAARADPLHRGAAVRRSASRCRPSTRPLSRRSPSSGSRAVLTRQRPEPAALGPSRSSCSATAPHLTRGRGRRAGRRTDRGRRGAVAAARLRRTRPTTTWRSPRPTSRRCDYTHDLMELGHPQPGPAGRAGPHLGPQLRPAGRVADHAARPTSPSRATTRSAQLTELAAEVLPRVESLQNYVWRRHLASAGARLMAGDPAAPRHRPARCRSSSTSSASPRAARSSTRPSWSAGSSTSRPSAPGSSSTTAAG